MKNYTKLIKHNTEQVRVYKELIEALKTIKAPLREFDGKVVNIKLERLLENATDKESFNIGLNKDYNDTKQIYIYNKNRNYRFGVVNRDGYQPTAYVDDYEINIRLEEKRLDAIKIIKDIDNRIEKLEKNINVLENAIENIEKIDNEYKEIYELIKEFNKKVPYQFRELYNFRSVY